MDEASRIQVAAKIKEVQRSVGNLHSTITNFLNAEKNPLGIPPSPVNAWGVRDIPVSTRGAAVAANRRTVANVDLADRPARVLGVILISLISAGSLVAQNAVLIRDSNGNQATAAVYGENFYYHDSKGNFATGTMKDGRVFISASNGENVFGTVKDGNVYLADQKGITTGTIRNGNIFLSSSDGTFTSGTYDSHGNSRIDTTNTASPAATPAASTDPQLQQRIEERREQDYEAGYALGYGLGIAIGAAIDRHKLNSFCKSNPKQTYEAKDGTKTPCQEAPLTAAAQKSADGFCLSHPFRRINYGLRVITCDVPPIPLNLYWATCFLENGQKLYQYWAKKKDSEMMNGVQQAFEMGRYSYCLLTGKGAAYNDLQGKEQRCQ